MTVVRWMVPPVAASRISNEPSPPSAIGQQSTRIEGSAARTPSAIASATSVASSDSLKLSGAQTTFMAAREDTLY